MVHSLIQSWCPMNQYNSCLSCDDCLPPNTRKGNSGDGEARQVKWHETRGSILVWSLIADCIISVPSGEGCFALPEKTSLPKQGCQTKERDERHVTLHMRCTASYLYHISSLGEHFSKTLKMDWRKIWKKKSEKQMHKLVSPGMNITWYISSSWSWYKSCRGSQVLSIRIRYMLCIYYLSRHLSPFSRFKSGKKKKCLIPFKANYSFITSISSISLFEQKKYI